MKPLSISIQGWFTAVDYISVSNDRLVNSAGLKCCSILCQLIR